MKLSKQERDEYVYHNYKRLTNKQLAESTGWSSTTIKSSMVRQGLSKIENKALEAAKEYILKYSDSYSALEISEELGCKADKVRDLQKSLGIWRSPEDMAFLSLQKKYEGIFLLERKDYINCKVNIKAVCCVCNTERFTRPNRMVTENILCSVCEKTKRAKTRLVVLKERNIIKAKEKVINNAILEKELVHRRELVMRNQYGSNYTLNMLSRDIVNIRCLICNIDKEVTYTTATRALGRVSRGTVCEHVCSSCKHKARAKKTKDTFISWCTNNGYTIIGEYVDSSTNIEVLCPQGHHRYASSYTTMKYGCQECRSTMETYVYILYMIDIDKIKIGISNRVSRRVRELTTVWGNILVVKEYKMIDRGTALDLESIAHRDLQKYRAFSEGAEGYSEIFNITEDYAVNYLVPVSSR